MLASCLESSFDNSSAPNGATKASGETYWCWTQGMDGNGGMIIDWWWLWIIPSFPTWNAPVNISTYPSKKWMSTGRYPSVNHGYGTQFRDHPQGESHGFSTNEAMDFPLIDSLHRVPWSVLVWPLIFCIKRRGLSSVSSHKFNGCCKIDIKYVWSPVKWMH